MQIFTQTFTKSHLASQSLSPPQTPTRSPTKVPTASHSPTPAPTPKPDFQDMEIVGSTKTFEANKAESQGNAIFICEMKRSITFLIENNSFHNNYYASNNVGYVIVSTDVDINLWYFAKL